MRFKLLRELLKFYCADLPMITTMIQMIISTIGGISVPPGISSPSGCGSFA